MFRFAAFVGIEGGELSRLVDLLSASAPDWRTVYSARDVRVLCRGTRPGSSEVYTLQGGGGVVLGKLFRSAGTRDHRHAPLTIEAGESREILQSSGRRLISHYWGRYVAVLRDPGADETYIVRDPSGALPCLQLHINAIYTYVSSMEDGALLLQHPPTINWDYIAAWLCARVNGRETGLREVEQVLGGECELIRVGEARREIYWHPLRIAEAGRIEARDLAIWELRDTVRAVVQAWASCYERILLALSGGLDSSIVASCLRDAAGGARVTCYTHYISGPASDERAFAQASADSAGLTLVAIPRDAMPDLRGMLNVRKTATLWNLIHHTEFGHTEAELATRHDAKAVFTGEGGDQAFYQARGEFAAADYLRHHGLRPHGLTVALDAARMDSRSIWDVIGRSMLAQLPGCAWSPKQDIGQFRSLLTPATVDTVRRNGSAVHPWFRQPPRAGSGTCWHAAMLTLKPPFYPPLLPDLDRPDPVAPLMSQPVIELCLRIAPWLHIDTGWDRAIARQAFERELPEAVVARRAKGDFEEHARRVLLHNIGFARELLCDGELVRHGVLNGPNVNEVLSNAPTLLETGNLEIYDYLSVEAWLRSWGTTQVFQ